MKSYLEILTVLVYFLISIGHLIAQPLLPLNSTGDISFTMDYNCFKGVNDFTNTRFTVALFTDDFNSHEEGDGLLINAEFYLRISLTDLLINIHLHIFPQR